MSPNTNSDAKSNPNEHLDIPKWINEEYFEPIIDSDVPNFKKIISFKTVAATAPGENYTSIMVRVFMDIELKGGDIIPVSYILKTELEKNSQGAVLVNSMNLFPKEKMMYQTILPKFKELYKEAGVDIDFGPTCLHIEDTSEIVTLVMEDLNRQNFVNIDRLKGLDMEHITRVLQKLAELHAVSAVYYELNGPYDDLYNLSFYVEENRSVFEAIGEARQQMYRKAMRKWGLENVEQYISKMPTVTEFFDKALQINSVDPNDFNVLNHGDAWCNNIMFNYKENGHIDNVRFVDFQVGKWGSPAQDLWYMITTSASLDIKIKEFDHFIQIYHERLVECLQLLKYSKPILTLRDLHISLLKHGSWGPMTANGVLVAILLPTDKDANIESMMKMGAEGDEYRYKTFINPLYMKAMCQLYPFFDNKGLLN